MSILDNFFVSLWVGVAFFLDVLFGNRWDPNNAVAIEPVVMSARRLKQYQDAQVFAAEVFFLDPTNLDPKYPDYTFIYDDPNDRVMVVLQDETCYGVFKGAETKGIENIVTDMAQGFGYLGSQRVCGGAGCCLLDRGLTRAYYSDYVNEFEAQLRSCVTECEGGCEVVITGHSQGASIGHIAAVALADLNPMLFAFGPQKVIHWPFSCSVLDNMDVFYRTQSLCENGGQPAYDIQPYAGVLWGKNTGTLILVSQGGAATLARNRDVFLTPVLDKCHNVFKYYIDPIMKLSADVPLDGFSSGSMCTRHIECQSRSCSNRRCS